jgi:lipopolysaccharide export system protein LptC
MKRSISLTLFIIMCFVVLWTITTDHSDEAQDTMVKSKRYIELFMNEFQLTSMDKEGRPSYMMTGTELKRYSNSQDTEVSQPVLHLLQQDNQWVINADTAFFNDKKNTIRLKNNVLMQQKNVTPAVNLRTQSMLVNTKTQIAQTKAHVNITKGNSTLNSEGMIYNNVTSELKLLSRVNGLYEPNE